MHISAPYAGTRLTAPVRYVVGAQSGKGCRNSDTPKDQVSDEASVDLSEEHVCRPDVFVVSLHMIIGA